MVATLTLGLAIPPTGTMDANVSRRASMTSELLGVDEVGAANPTGIEARGSRSARPTPSERAHGEQHLRGPGSGSRISRGVVAEAENETGQQQRNDGGSDGAAGGAVSAPVPSAEFERDGGSCVGGGVPASAPGAGLGEAHGAPRSMPASQMVNHAGGNGVGVVVHGGGCGSWTPRPTRRPRARRRPYFRGDGARARRGRLRDPCRCGGRRRARR